MPRLRGAFFMHQVPLSSALQTYQTRVSVLKKGYAQEVFRIKQLANSQLGALRIDQITSVDIANYRDHRLASLNPKTQKPISTGTVRLEMSLLSNLFELAITEWGYCENNPVKKVRKPKSSPGRDRRLTARERRLILRYCHSHPNPELYSIVVIALETAMRQGEILGLAWEHINLSSRIASLQMTKNGTKRDVPLTYTARDMLIRLGAKSTGPVFTYTAAGIKSTWRQAMQRLAIEDLHFHDLRHEAVSVLFERGRLDMMEISAISGHKSLSMLKRYTHLKAGNLLRKMDQPKNKAKAAMLSQLIPYPAEVRVEGGRVCVKLLDFEGLQVDGDTVDAAIERAEDRLLRHLFNRMRMSQPIPSPDQYLEAVPAESIVMIDPLSERFADEVCD